MWLNQDFTCTFTHICYFYSGSTIHIYPSISISRITQNILLLIWERITKKKYILFFPCEINAQVILLLPLAILSQEMSALKIIIIRENKKKQVLGTSKERKSETRGKNRQVSDSRIRGTRYPPERKEKKKKSISFSS